MTACPAGVDVPGFVEAIARDDPDAAAATIFAENLLGGTCARVCPVEMLCEGACVLRHEGRKPIEIGRLQRFATDVALAGGAPLRRSRPRNWYPRRSHRRRPGRSRLRRRARGARIRRHRVRRASRAGRTRAVMRSRPTDSSREPLPAEVRALQRLGVKFELGLGSTPPTRSRTSSRSTTPSFLPSGWARMRMSTYPGDELPGVWNSLPFIEAIKTGSPPDVGSSVAVIGGGNTAIDVAREALRLGAERGDARLPAHARGDAGVCARGRRGTRGRHADRVADGARSSSSEARR